MGMTDRPVLSVSLGPYQTLYIPLIYISYKTP